MSSHPDVLIVGGGVIGLTAAYHLARERVRVTVIDKGDFGQEASWAGAGIIPPGDLDHARTPLDRLRAHSAALFPELSEELREPTGIDNGYLQNGGLEFLGAGEEAVVDDWRDLGIEVEALEEDELHRIEPALAAGLTHAHYLPAMAQVRNPRHIKALVAWCDLHGVRLRPGCPASGFDVQGGRVVAVRTPLGALSAGRYLLATGAWTEPMLEQLGWRPGIRPVKGQIALLHTGAPLLGRILLQGPRYIVPRPDGRVLVGSTEEDAGFDKRTTAGGVGELLAFAVGLVPGLAAAAVERCWAGLRPGSPDGLPFLGAVPGLANLFVAAGHFRAGIQLSPATGLVMKELLLGQPPSVPLESFRLDRPTAAPQRSAFRS